ncbi:MAG: hypothetical protein KY439_05530 [Actinobacteria bacterium]|nr:hypothetical protein [Actinomycetota bacterium]
MEEGAASVQRSFRLSRATSDLLDEAAATANESRNALADRLLGEALRTERHPMIRFRTGAAGRREPHVLGTRLLVRQIVATVQAHDGSVEAASTYLQLPSSVVRSAITYYADFRDEVDDDARWASRLESDERQRWERAQGAIA